MLLVCVSVIYTSMLLDNSVFFLHISLWPFILKRLPRFKCFQQSAFFCSKVCNVLVGVKLKGYMGK